MKRFFRTALSLILCLITVLSITLIAPNGIFGTKANAYAYLECKNCGYRSEDYANEDELQKNAYTYLSYCTNSSCSKYHIVTYYNTKEEMNKASAYCPQCSKKISHLSSNSATKVSCSKCDYKRILEPWESAESVCPKCSNKLNRSSDFRCPKCGDLADGCHLTFAGRCLYCMKVQEISETELPDDAKCPECGKLYDVQLADSIDENGKLLPTGAGKFIYCKKTGKIYDYYSENKDKCIYCGENHSIAYKNNFFTIYHKDIIVEVYFELQCPDCGTICKRSDGIDSYKEPVLLGTLHNTFGAIFQKISGSAIEPDKLDISNKCNKCQHYFTDDDIKNAVRYVDAPASFQYEKAANDRSYKESYYYKIYGSNNDIFFEKLIWNIKKLFSFYILHIDNPDFDCA